MNNKKDLFENKSKSWDMNSKRVQNAKDISEKIVKNIKLDKSMEIMDFGAGTGLLSYFISHKVAKVVAIDNSLSMLEKFHSKADDFFCETEILEKDLSVDILDRKFDGIISSMTIHHLKDTFTLLKKMYNMLENDGFIAIADLDSEDGSFHSDTNGVFHYGFDRESLESIAKEVGFKEIKFELVSTIRKSQAEFTVFLMTAFR
jgi:cyclopropane fatty-acyl-phospholipid synthase-like methyltransferase